MLRDFLQKLRKKTCKNIWWVRENVVTLHSQTGSNAREHIRGESFAAFGNEAGCKRLMPGLPGFVPTMVR